MQPLDDTGVYTIAYHLKGQVRGIPVHYNKNWTYWKMKMSLVKNWVVRITGVDVNVDSLRVHSPRKAYNAAHLCVFVETSVLETI